MHESSKSSTFASFFTKEPLMSSNRSNKFPSVEYPPFFTDKVIRHPLTEKDCLFIMDRHKKDFDVPVHSHNVWELSLIEGGKGLTRVVGDSVVEIDDWELVLVTQSELRHTWQGVLEGEMARAVTIQFPPDLISSPTLRKRQFRPIAHLFERARRGVSFSRGIQERVTEEINKMIQTTDAFEQVLRFMHILYVLAHDEGAEVLCSESFANVQTKLESHRIEMIDAYLKQHYTEVIRLSKLAEMVEMTEVGFSRFFKRTMGVTLSDYLIGLRVSHASRMLVDTDCTVSEIAYACGFNNISNFNRLFRKHRGRSPQQFRALYSRTRKLI